MVVCPKCQALSTKSTSCCKCGCPFAQSNIEEVTEEARRRVRELVHSLPERPRSARAALPWMLLGVAGLGAGICALFMLDIPPLGSIGFILGLFVLSVSLRKAIKPLQRSAQALMRKDARDPVLYCRPFRRDDEPLGSLAAQAATVAFESSPVRMLWQERGGYSLETPLSHAVQRLGPFVAIGSPNERHPALGACRLYCANDQWQAAFRTIVEGASAIIAQAPATESALWELETVIESGAARKLFIVLPTDQIERRRALRELESLRRWGVTLPRAELLDQHDNAVLAFRSASEPLIFVHCRPFFRRVLRNKSADALYSAFVQCGLPVKPLPRMLWAGTHLLIWFVLFLGLVALGLFEMAATGY